MMPSSELITVLRTGAHGLDPTIRFLILDVCDRLERRTRDVELLANKIVELKTRTVKTNADRIRAMSDEELAKHFSGLICSINEGVEYHEAPSRWLEWLKQHEEVQK